MYLCVCRTARTFIEEPSSSSAARRPYQIAVVGYQDILAETETLQSTTPIEKLFIFQVPQFLGGGILEEIIQGDILGNSYLYR